MRTYSTIINRRCVFGSIAGFAISVVLAKLPFEVEQSSEIAAPDQEFLVVNGWILTRKDMIANEVMPDVV
jgi:hypothetical protein